MNSRSRPLPPDLSTSSPRALDSLQRQFQAYVLRREPAVLERVRATGKADAATRMDVYADGYVIRLLEALQTDFPGLAALAGADDFERLGRAYIEAHPSRYRNLRWYGGALPDFLAAAPAWRERAGIADMARFEWAMSLSFDAADAEAMQREHLATVAPDDWPNLKFAVHPAVQTVGLRYNVAPAWSAQARGEALPAMQAAEQPVTWLLTRRQLQVRFRAMAADEAAAFERLREGETFAQWCEVLAATVGEDGAAVRAVQCLGQWLADGALAGWTLDPA
jgi:hypothetical protein